MIFAYKKAYEIMSVWWFKSDICWGQKVVLVSHSNGFSKSLLRWTVSVFGWHGWLIFNGCSGEMCDRLGKFSIYRKLGIWPEGDVTSGDFIERSMVRCLYKHRSGSECHLFICQALPGHVPKTLKTLPCVFAQFSLVHHAHTLTKAFCGQAYNMEMPSNLEKVECLTTASVWWSILDLVG